MPRFPRLVPGCMALLLLAQPLRADGPHWHVPNPDGDEEETSVDNEKGNKAPAAEQKPAHPAPAPVLGGSGNRDYDKNPGDFLKMDPACIDYYQRHAVIEFVGQIKTKDPIDSTFKAKNEKDFYLLIMQRCAQAMREVDNYLPCPDSFPLWQTDELREKMLDYAARTWLRGTQLHPELAQACAEMCVKCYVQTVRFRDPAKDSQSKSLTEVMKGNLKMRDLLEKMSTEQDPVKKKALWEECQKILLGTGLTSTLTRALLTFNLITGDIPPLVDDAESRMMLALVNMGGSVLPFLQNETKNPNPAVQKAVWTVIDMIQRHAQKPRR